MSPVTGWLFDRVGVRWLAPLGMTILVITLIGFANLTTSTSYTSVVILHVGFMFGVSMGMMPVMTNGLNQLPRRLHSHGTAIVNTVQQVSAALGTALLVTVISIGSQNYLLVASQEGPSALQGILATNQGIVYAFMVSAVLAGLGLLLSLFMRSTTSPAED
jgi:MFS family permease